MKRMRLKIITHEPRPINIDQIFESISGQLPNAEISIERLSKNEYNRLPSIFKKIDAAEFSHILIDLPFKHLHKHANILNKIGNLTVYEEDACQDRIFESKWFGKFSKFYLKIPHAKIINTGFSTATHFQVQGISSTAVAKGFDSRHLVNMHNERTVPLGFVGSTRSTVYMERKRTIQRMEKEMNLQTFSTQSIQEYCAVLNSIRIFFSADIGIGEYMAKNFEAMACGCLLVAYRQGSGEEEFLGLEDGHNAILFSDFDEAVIKIRSLMERPDLLNKIASAGEKHARRHFSFKQTGTKIAHIIKKKPDPTSKKIGLASKIKHWIGYR